MVVVIFENVIDNYMFRQFGEMVTDGNRTDQIAIVFVCKEVV